MTALVTLDVWRVPPRRLPAALRRVATDRVTARRAPGARFAKVLGTGDGRTFSPRDATPCRWALLVAWDGPADADRFAGSRVARGWAELAAESCHLRLVPLGSRGRWSGRAPFGASAAAPAGGPVAALTRARLRPAKAAAFWRAVPPVAAEVRGAAGLRLALAVGDAPVGLQGTFSVWDSAAALERFVHRPAHAEAVRRTPLERWYAEELFARFAVVGATGTVDGVGPLP